MIDAKIKCVAPWAGGKRTLAPRIVELLGPHKRYVEPFVGGCAIIPAKRSSPVEMLNDANPAIYNVLRMLRDADIELLRILKSEYPFSRECYELAKAEILTRGNFTRVGSVELAAAQLAVWWMGPSGLAGTTQPGWFAIRHTKTGGSPEVRYESFTSSVHALANRIRHAGIYNDDFTVFFTQVEDEGHVSIYVDPPYFTKEFSYVCDFRPSQHESLARILNGYPPPCPARW